MKHSDVRAVLLAVMSNIPALQDGRVLVDAAAFVVVLAVLRVMLRTRFLFRIIPT
jgi:hypothetical protein